MKTKIISLWRLMSVVVLGTLLVGCAHPIVISPLNTPSRSDSSLSPRKVAYVITEADRNKQVTTDGGGGDKVSYFPYRDLEKLIRETLRSVYTDVVSMKAASDKEAIQEHNVSLIFVPTISTASSSSSVFTWPPTKFDIDLSCNVYDASGKVVSQVGAVGNGVAEFSEFKSDLGLAGRRAATDLGVKLKQAITSDPKLR